MGNREEEKRGKSCHYPVIKTEMSQGVIAGLIEDQVWW